VLGALPPQRRGSSFLAHGRRDQRVLEAARGDAAARGMKQIAQSPRPLLTPPARRASTLTSGQRPPIERLLMAVGPSRSLGWWCLDLAFTMRSQAQANARSL
jgi:hypothetical protein